jgi:hypothetical protein
VYGGRTPPTPTFDVQEIAHVIDINAAKRPPGWVTDA